MIVRGALRLTVAVWAVAVLLLVAAQMAGARLPRGPQLAYLTDCRGWENIALADVRYGLHRPLTCNRSGKSQMAWSHDGRYLAYYNNGAALFSLVVLDVATGDQRVYAFDNTRYYNSLDHPLTWSPDGDRIAFIATTANELIRRLFTLDLATGDITQVTTTTGLDAANPGWSPVDASVLQFQRGEYLYTVDPYTDAPPVAVAPRVPYLWTADGAQVRYTDSPATLQMIAIDGTVREITLPGGIRLLAVTAAPDGSQIAVVVAGDSGLVINRINTETGRAEAVASSLYYLGQPTWSPDGAWLAYVETDTRNGGDNIILHHFSSGRHVPLVTTPHRDWSPVWRPGG
jgi:Tol biopolymer transport system component